MKNPKKTVVPNDLYSTELVEILDDIVNVFGKKNLSYMTLGRMVEQILIKNNLIEDDE